MSRILTKLIVAIVLLIFTIEGVLLVVSINKHENELRQLQQVELIQYSQNKIFTEEYIQMKCYNYKRNISMLTLLISLFVAFGFFVIYQKLVGQYIGKITQLNNELSPINTKSSFQHIPNDEIGDLIRSRISMLDLLEEQINENKKLVRILSHDLNNSLFVILGQTDILKIKGKHIKDKFFSKSLEKIRVAGNAQKSLISKVSEIDAAKSNKVATDLKEVRLLDIFNASYTIFEDKLISKSLTLSLDNEDGFLIKVDQTLFFNNVLNNLISNAIKFSKTGDEIIISTKTLDDGTKEIRIKDEGIGIPKELIVKLFDAYSQTTRIGTDGEKGTGFGMPLVKETVALFGGSIEVKSNTSEESSGAHGTEIILKLK